ELGATKLDVAFNYSDVSHVMDNYSLRSPPAMPLGYRETLAVGDGYTFRIGSVTPFDAGELRLGIDGELASHTATITNPNLPAFRIDNFNDVERDVVGLYAQWNRAQGPFDIELGVRVNRVELNTDEIAAVVPP